MSAMHTVHKPQQAASLCLLATGYLKSSLFQSSTDNILCSKITNLLVINIIHEKNVFFNYMPIAYHTTWKNPLCIVAIRSILFEKVFDKVFEKVFENVFEKVFEILTNVFVFVFKYI